MVLEDPEFYSGGNGSDYVEVGGAERAVAVRDSKHRGVAALTFGADAWRRFAAAIKDADQA